MKETFIGMRYLDMVFINKKMGVFMQGSGLIVK